MVEVDPILKRPLGNTSIKVSSVGFGCWGLCDGWGQSYSDSYISNLLDVAWDKGINLFDTAGVYGNGLGETALNKKWKYNAIITTKISAEVKPVKPILSIQKYYNKQYCFNQVENAIHRLGRDYIDVLYFHNWYAEWINEADYMLEIFSKLKASGKVRAVGVSIPEQSHYNLEEMPFLPYVDVVQLSLNIFEQNALDLIDFARKKNTIAIIAKSPLKQGILAKDLENQKLLPSNDYRHSRYWSQKAVWAKRIQRTCEIIKIKRDRLPYFALAYILSIPQISSVLVGMRKIKHVDSNTNKVNFRFDEWALQQGRLLSEID